MFKSLIVGRCLSRLREDVWSFKGVVMVVKGVIEVIEVVHGERIR